LFNSYHIKYFNIIKINKIFFPFIKILFTFLIITFIEFYCAPIYSKTIEIEEDLAIKYCDSVDKNLFNGLETEMILKYKYFFNNVDTKEIQDKEKFINKLEKSVMNRCNDELLANEKSEFISFIKLFLINED
tara:strand:- start:398 stop:793 length:396 start_codon:yes stop_codon:yes gene_type:complete